MNPIYLGLIRHALTIAGGALVTRGYMDEGSLDEVAGALVALLGVGWSVWAKRRGAAA